MARSNKKTSSVKVEKTTSSSSNFSGMNFDIQNNRSMVNLILGAAVLVVLGVVLFNFFSKQNANNQADLGPSGQTDNTQQGDVAKDSLPGKYTVKEGDTLFLIAQKYYDDGFKYSELVTTNKLTDENNLEVGQVLDIPKLEGVVAQASSTPMASASSAPVAEATPQPAVNQGDTGTGGDPSQTIWGTKISDPTYTVQTGDWLSKISGRAYGDVMMFQKIAQANNISNPDLIEVGTVLKIPR